MKGETGCTGMAAAHLLSGLFGLSGLSGLFSCLTRERPNRRDRLNPLSPGYLFAQFELERHYRAVSYAAGVHKVVEFGSGPVELDATMIDAIKERLNDGYVTPQSERFKMGQIVHIKGGPLTGLEAVFMREMTDRNKGAFASKYAGDSCQAYDRY